jgi:predicted RNase H-like HicB family nuclease
MFDDNRPGRTHIQFSKEVIVYRFLIIEKGDTSYGAYAPDLPGCVAVGETREEVEREMRAAIALHLQEMSEDNEPIPNGESIPEYVEISLPDQVA